MEKESIASLVGLDNAVIATGGGSVLDGNNLSILKRLGKLMYLQADKATIKRRALSGALPAFLDRHNPEESFDQMYRDRKKTYEVIAATVIDIKKGDNEDIINKIVREIQYGK